MTRYRQYLLDSPAGSEPNAPNRFRRIEERPMKLHRWSWMTAILALIFGLLSPGGLMAQDTKDSQKPAEPPEGINSGNYNFRQSVEFGYRMTDFTGNRSVYDTFVNLNDGPRLLDYTLEMRSLNHQGSLFDNFYLSNFGYGGDPNNVTRLRAYKNKWYSLTGQFRRDLNFWDYDLLANPLNPTNTFVQVFNSPHGFHTVRRMSDLNLILMPQSRVRLRLGYVRSVAEGPSFSSIHDGTDFLLAQNWKTTTNAYSFGVDYKGLERTNISYDQTFNYYKGDTTWTDPVLTGMPNFLTRFQLSDGSAVDAGLPYNVAGSQPCSNTPPIFSPGTPPVLKSACNGVTNGTARFASGGASFTIPGYDRAGRVRSSFPTEQISFQSNYFRNLDLSGRAIYSDSDSQSLDFQELFFGLITRTNERAFLSSGPATSHVVNATVDFAATYRFTEKLRFVDSFRFRNYRIPGAWLFNNASVFPTASPVTLLSPVSSSPQACLTTSCIHSSSSPADISSGLWSELFKQDIKMNTAELEYDFTRRYGVRIGYRFRHRTIIHSLVESTTETFYPSLANRGDCALVSGSLPDGCTALGNGGFQFVTPLPLEPDSDTTEINEHTGLFGFWARPTDRFRGSFDLERMSADNTFTRISPSDLELYKVRVRYQPLEWLHVGTAINLVENRNNTFQVDNHQHDRTYAFNVEMQKGDRFGLELEYEYSNVFSSSNICYAFSPLPAGTTAPPCPISASGVSPIAGTSLYDTRTHFGYFDAMWKPFKRITTHLGYTVTTTNGQTTFLNPNSPPGPLEFNYHRPYADLDIELAKGLSYKTHWGYYGYNEREPSDPITGSRKFRGNLATFSVRYAF
jgi:hypothetical protein